MSFIRFGLNNVVVIKDEDKIIRDGGDFIEQGCQNRWAVAEAAWPGAQPTLLRQYSPQSSAEQPPGKPESE